MTKFVVNHPDGTKSVRNSKRGYTHAVVIAPASTEDIVAKLISLANYLEGRGIDRASDVRADIEDVMNGHQPTRTHEARVIANYGVLRWTGSARLAQNGARDAMARSFINDGCGITIEEVEEA